MLPPRVDEPIVFFGGKDHLPLLSSLTAKVAVKKLYSSNSGPAPHVPGWALKKFETNARTNWHYECVLLFLNLKRLCPVTFDDARNNGP